MKIMKLMVLLFLINIFLPSLSADPRRCMNNDTIVGVNEDQNNLMNYLKGTWNVSGSWQIVEGEGKVKKSIKARLTGTDTYTAILNGHFLQKSHSGHIKYESRDLGKTVQNSFSAMSILTFNKNMNQFYNWYFDCSGSFIESSGSFNHEENRYGFESKIISDRNKEVENLYSIIIVDDNHYRWEVKQRADSTSDWEIVSSGLSTRKN